jgi:hypothetical protein
MAPAGCAPAYTAADEAASRVSPTPVEGLGREVDQGRGRGRRTFAPKRCPRRRATHPKPAPPPESKTHRGARGEAPSPPHGAHRHAARRFGRTHGAPLQRVFVGIHDLHRLLDPRPPPGTRRPLRPEARLPPGIRAGRPHHATLHRVFVGIRDLRLLLDPRPAPGTRRPRRPEARLPPGIRAGRPHRATLHRVFVGIRDLHRLLDPRPPPGTRADRSAPKRGSNPAPAPSEPHRATTGSSARWQAQHEISSVSREPSRPMPPSPPPA